MSFFEWIAIVLAIGLIVVFLASPFIGIRFWRKSIDDSYDDGQRLQVEGTCRELILQWEEEVFHYQQKGDDESKARANCIANKYNRYLLDNGYVFDGEYPEGIYAVLDPIEDKE